ncbi:UNKNOWN [Stylonychia lemnae]|uniref:Uncharacterized protein n=1 Tax=Stylonychia lemnae TaxID=5949 RepID=A0A077ZYA3_STYLE|nr:UNKNOWN [Stylonychia lemnae]|eukprot:CDW74881.1 UNKNOWN [Stylonychia lemnae]
MEKELGQMKNDKIKSKSEEYFDKIDFIFIDGDSLNYMPWHSDNEQIRLLVKNCIKSNKCVFGSHVLFSTLIYLKSLGANNFKISQKIKVINNDQKGDFNIKSINISNDRQRQRIKSLNHFQNRLSIQSNQLSMNKQSELNETDIENVNLILLNTTGELYEFNKQLNQMQLFARTGLIRNMNDVHSSNMNLSSSVNFREADCNNIVVYKSGSAVHNPLMKGVLDVLHLSNNFFYDFCWKTNKSVAELYQIQIQTIMSTQLGIPLIVESGNILANQFNKIFEFQKESQLQKLLQNFISSKIQKMQEMGFIHLKLRDTTIHQNNGFLNQNSSNSSISQFQSGSHKFSKSMINPANSSSYKMIDSMGTQKLDQNSSINQGEYMVGQAKSFKITISKQRFRYRDKKPQNDFDLDYSMNDSFNQTHLINTNSSNQIFNKQYNNSTQSQLIRDLKQDNSRQRVRTSNINLREKYQKNMNYMNGAELYMSSQTMNYKNLNHSSSNNLINSNQIQQYSNQNLRTLKPINHNVGNKTISTNFRNGFQKKKSDLDNQWVSGKNSQTLILSMDKMRHRRIESTIIVNEKPENINKEETFIGEFKIEVPKRLISIPKKVKQVKIVYQIPKKIA